MHRRLQPAHSHALRRRRPPGAGEPELPARPYELSSALGKLRTPSTSATEKLLKRVFEIDMEHCPFCGGLLKIIAAILEQPVIEKILTHLGQRPGRRRVAPARAS